VRVFPNKPESFFVSVFASLADARRYSVIQKRRQGSALVLGRHGKALVRTWTSYAVGHNRLRRRGGLGELIFARRFLGIGVVSHEALHAVLHWGRVKRVALEGGKVRRGVIGSGEEIHCYAMTNLTRRIYNELYRRKVLT
jgi:hypothetical protein